MYNRPDSDEPSRVQGDNIERWYLFVQWTPRDTDAAKDLKSKEKRSLYLILNAVAGFISPLSVTTAYFIWFILNPRAYSRQVTYPSTYYSILRRPRPSKQDAPELEFQESGVGVASSSCEVASSPPTML